MALAHWLSGAISFAQDATRPKRLMILHRPNGTVTADWLPNGVRGRVLEPFNAVWPYTVALSGIELKPGVNYDKTVDPHGAGLVTLMTGAGMSTKIPQGSDDGRWNLAESIDLVWSRQSKLLNGAPIKNIQVAANGRMSGLQEPQNRTLSYAGPEQPLYPVVNPYDVANRLFASIMPAEPTAQQKLRTRRQTVLAFVKNDLARVRKQYPASLRPTLDAHEGTVRELEMALGDPPVAPTCKKPVVPEGLPVNDLASASVEKDGAAQLAIIKAAFECDLTRVVTFMWGPGASAGAFSQFGVSDHHRISHGANYTQLSNIDRWFSERTAPFIKSLIDTADPTGGKLIDNTLVWYVSEVATGPHSFQNMPYLLFGGDGVGLKQRGRVVVANGKTSTDIWLSMAPTFGMAQVTSFPTPHTGPIAGLFT